MLLKKFVVTLEFDRKMQQASISKVRGATLECAQSFRGKVLVFFLKFTGKGTNATLKLKR
jgi:hypothetical protein